jgi:hypothetical protein
MLKRIEYPRRQVDPEKIKVLDLKIRKRTEDFYGTLTLEQRLTSKELNIDYKKIKSDDGITYSRKAELLGKSKDKDLLVNLNPIQTKKLGVLLLLLADLEYEYRMKKTSNVTFTTLLKKYKLHHFISITNNK